MTATVLITFSAFFCGLVSGHIAAWHKGMYCLNGTSGADEQTTNAAVQPLYQLSRTDWWFHHINQCDEFPPVPGDFLELPAGGSFTVELAVNRAFTTLAFGGANTADFGDGQDHPGLGGTSCVEEPNIHAQNESMAAGTAFAISYQSELSQVTPENLVVFTILYNTPWRRVATYSVPKLPACPSEGCVCAWGWVANGCGEPNMYMQGFKCKVTGATGSASLAPAAPPAWCEDSPASCVRGAKQMVYWNQLEGNNIHVEGVDLAGSPRAPTYNAKLGFANGAQTDIFLAPGTASTTSIAPSPTGAPGENSGAGPRVYGSLFAAARLVVFLYLVSVFVALL